MSSILGSIIRRNVSKVVLVPQFEPKVIEDVKNNKYKPRHHPGTRSREVITAPSKVFEATNNLISKTHHSNLEKDAKVMWKYMIARQLPPENREIVENMHKIKNEFMSEIGLDNVDIEETYSEEDIDLLNKGVRRQVNKVLKERTYNWQPVDYTEHISRVYLWSRFVPDYAVLVKVLEEIYKQLPNFKPHSVFDFGSGIGTAIWATHSYWPKSIGEFYCVDTSDHMLDLSSLLLQGGRQNKQPCISHVVYRQFLPSSTTNQYSLVICAYSLLELPSQKHRIQTIAKLWEKTEDFLVIVDLGSASGNQVVLEARDYILSTNNKRPGSAHVFAPCPHDLACPKQQLANHCTFSVKYENMRFKRGERIILPENFSYVILRRGERRDPLTSWPRVVRPVLQKSKHSVCKLCTNEGSLAQLVFTNRKHGV
ncbi:hypothetical protein M8J77_015358 [Diaphorina citri]|nr:hypothetical protein M8J77_015358 [Diaphorina citri]